MKPYIKGIPRCICKHIHPRAGWYVSYTPHNYVLCSPEERFNSTNNESISSNHYRRAKFSAKMTFHIFIGVHLSICTPSNNKSFY